MATKQLFVPLFLQTELERLATSLDVTYTIGDEASENEYLYFLDEVVTKIETLQEEVHQSKQQIVTQANNSNGQRYSLEELKFLAKTQQFETNVQKTIAQAESSVGTAEKLQKLTQKYHKERDQRKTLETFVQAQNKKIQILAEHIEKLMKSIRIETNKRLRCVEENRKLTKEQNGYLVKIEKQVKIQVAQHK
jgi:hypothetical protein